MVAIHPRFNKLITCKTKKKINPPNQYITRDQSTKDDIVAHMERTFVPVNVQQIS